MEVGAQCFLMRSMAMKRSSRQINLKEEGANLILPFLPMNFSSEKKGRKAFQWETKIITGQ